MMEQNKENLLSEAPNFDEHLNSRLRSSTKSMKMGVQ
jgi:hypothetical protein